jgi:hypothetical protein
MSKAYDPMNCLGGGGRGGPVLPVRAKSRMPHTGLPAVDVFVTLPLGFVGTWPAKTEADDGGIAQIYRVQPLRFSLYCLTALNRATPWGGQDGGQGGARRVVHERPGRKDRRSHDL